MTIGILDFIIGRSQAVRQECVLVKDRLKRTTLSRECRYDLILRLAKLSGELKALSEVGDIALRLKADENLTFGQSASNTVDDIKRIMEEMKNAKIQKKDETISEVRSK